jgi:hypothetical protein
MISDEAEFCPHCGKSFRKHHGVFYYVCAVLGSLFLLGCLAGIAFFVFVTIAAAARARAAAQRQSCESNLKQIGIAFRMWQLDHNDLFPFNLSLNEGGSLEYCGRDANGVDTNSLHHLLVITNELYSPHVLTCPGYTGTVASAWTDMTQDAVSYHLHTARQRDLNPEGILAFCPTHRMLLRCDGSVSWAWRSEIEEESDALAVERKARDRQTSVEAATKQAEEERQREVSRSDQLIDQQRAESEAELLKLGVAHDWTFKTGKTFTAKLAAIQTSSVLVKVRDGYDEQYEEKFRFYTLDTAQLSEQDQRIVAALKKQGITKLP